MFFPLFRANPRLPVGWTVAHLWIAQVSIATLFQEGNPCFFTWGDPRTRKRRILCNVQRIVPFMLEDYDYPTDDFEDEVLEGLSAYLESEMRHILHYARTHRPEDCRLNPDVIMKAMREDIQHRLAGGVRISPTFRGMMN